MSSGLVDVHLMLIGKLFTASGHLLSLGGAVPPVSARPQMSTQNRENKRWGSSGDFGLSSLLALHFPCLNLFKNSFFPGYFVAKPEHMKRPPPHSIILGLGQGLDAQ